MNKYNISVIVLNLIILSHLSYADNNSSKNIESKKIEEKPIFSLPQSEQVQSDSKSKVLTLEEVNKRLEDIEKRNIQEEVELETFEERVKAYQKKIEKLKAKETNE